MTFKDIFLKYFPEDRGAYADVYASALSNKRCYNILEIGIGTIIPGVNSSMDVYVEKGYVTGAGLRMWLEAYPNARIFGLDIQSDTQIKANRLYTAICDSTDALQVAKFFEHFGDVKMDVIVDDGSHKEYDQIRTLINFYQHLADDGVYFLEDVGARPPEGLTQMIERICGSENVTFHKTSDVSGLYVIL